MYKLKVIEEILRRFLEPRKRIQVIAGPRQVGKTTSVEQAVAGYHGGYTYKLAEGLGFAPLDWLAAEWNAARARAKADGGHLLIIDEIQKIKGWSEVVKRMWDEDSFHHVELKVCLLGSSRLLLQKGLEESLAGRFEMIDVWHWSFADMHAAFGYSLDDYILFGGYPGAADLRGDEVRWKQYVRDAIIEPSITLDILNLDTVAKPELLRQTFALGCTYAGKILSYQKMVGQLQDAGNTTTIAHYLRLLGEAGSQCGSARPVRSSRSATMRCGRLCRRVLPAQFAQTRNAGDMPSNLQSVRSFFPLCVGRTLISCIGTSAARKLTTCSDGTMLSPR